MTIKRFTVMALCIVFMLTFSGCGDKTNYTKEDTKTNNTEIVKNEKTENGDETKTEAGLVNTVEKTVTGEDFEITLQKKEYEDYSSLAIKDFQYEFEPMASEIKPFDINNFDIETAVAVLGVDDTEFKKGEIYRNYNTEYENGYHLIEEMTSPILVSIRRAEDGTILELFVETTRISDVPEEEQQKLVDKLANWIWPQEIEKDNFTTFDVDNYSYTHNNGKYSVILECDDFGRHDGNETRARYRQIQEDAENYFVKVFSLDKIMPDEIIENIEEYNDNVRIEVELSKNFYKHDENGRRDVLKVQCEDNRVDDNEKRKLQSHSFSVDGYYSEADNRLSKSCSYSIGYKFGAQDKDEACKVLDEMCEKYNVGEIMWEPEEDGISVGTAIASWSPTEFDGLTSNVNIFLTENKLSENQFPWTLEFSLGTLYT